MNEIGFKARGATIACLGFTSIANAYWNLTPEELIEISIKNDKQSVLKTINIHNKITSITIPINFMPLGIILDPKVNLLFDGNIEKEN